ncbi:4-aminobutyrate aminotransferase-like enzyme [Bradyrhizobium japonicum]
MSRVRNANPKLPVLNASESDVRACSHSASSLFSRARGSILLTVTGQRIIDFSAGAGTLNYGHNNHRIKDAMLEYLSADAMACGLDTYSAAKLKFIDTFNSVILHEREMRYRFRFTGPMHDMALVVALELSRKITKRQKIISFTRHPAMDLIISVTGDHGAPHSVSPFGTTVMPYDGCLGPNEDTASHVRKVLMEASSGGDGPAAILVETIEGVGNKCGWKELVAIDSNHSERCRCTFHN